MFKWILASIAILVGLRGGVASELHWAYRPLKTPSPSAVSNTQWCTSELDLYTLSKLEAMALEPSPQARPGTLLRRVCLDLTGLPPSQEVAAKYLQSPTSEGYRELVESLLASSRFGERWASWWLDVARYADTQGYEKDNLRTIWSYRDWVIHAFNTDLPFDEFTVEQLAGDLLPSPTSMQRLATAFHRNTMTNTEGGTKTEEFRTKAVIDRANTTALVWLGSTLGCAQCHDHPYDPISQRDYYSFYAFFNNTADANEADDKPLLTHLPVALQDCSRELKREQEEVSRQPASAERDARVRELERLQNELPETEVPVMRELEAGDRRETHLLHKGSYLSPGEVVEAATPAAMAPWSSSEPRTRLGLAHWLTSSGNGLPPRVIVNRVWEQLFGIGLQTSGDFGLQGGTPSHPELLDALAFHFSHEWRWSLKTLLREIVLSSTYRQSSGITPLQKQRDPSNRYLGRAARFRLPAEAYRDQVLAVSGLLSPKMYGRPVMPPQPADFWQVVYNVQRWVPSRGEDQDRRSIYTFWRRTSPYPALAVFDAPSRESCTLRRSASFTPATSLAGLNDETNVRAAEALGRRMCAEGGNSLGEKIDWAYRQITFCDPSQSARAALVKLFETEVARGQTPSAAFTAIGSALLNMDQAWMRE